LVKKTEGILGVKIPTNLSIVFATQRNEIRVSKLRQG
jgi:hypothetical protein